MSNCPVCNEPLIATICTTCGFDLSLSYEAYGSLSPDPKGKASLSYLQTRWQKSTENHLRCNTCGSISFSFLQNPSMLKCRRCGAETPIPGLVELEIQKANLEAECKAMNVSLALTHADLEHMQKELRHSNIEKNLLEKKVQSLMEGNSSKNMGGTRRTQPQKDTKESREEKGYPIVAVAAGGSHTVGLRKDGTVVAAGSKSAGECNVSKWTDVVMIAAGESHTVALRRDGSVMAVGANKGGCCEVKGEQWRDIIAIAAGEEHTVGLRKNGTVVTTRELERPYVEQWREVVQIAGGKDFTVGLKKDGTPISTIQGLFDQFTWKELTEIAAGDDFVIGLKKDGTVISTGVCSWRPPIIKTSDWKQIVRIAAGNHHAVGIKRDGTVVASGYFHNGQRRETYWDEIVAVSVGADHTVGLRRNGTVVVAGPWLSEKCNVATWGKP